MNGPEVSGPEAAFREAVAELVKRLDRAEAEIRELKSRQDAETDLACMNECRSSDALSMASFAVREVEILDRRLNEMNVYAFAFKAGSN